MADRTRIGGAKVNVLLRCRSGDFGPVDLDRFLAHAEAVGLALSVLGGKVTSGRALAPPFTPEVPSSPTQSSLWPCKSDDTPAHSTRR